MSVRDWIPGPMIENPRGAWTAVAQKQRGNPARGSFTQNCRVNPGVLGSRPGTEVIGPEVTSGAVTGIYNWIQPIASDFSGSITAVQGTLRLQCDSPDNGQFIYTPTVHILNGWSIAGVNTTTAVHLAIDGVDQGAVTIGIPRADVAAAWPGQAGSPNFGWQKSIDMAPFSAGIHDVKITATDSAATTVTLYTMLVVSSGVEENVVIYQDGNNINQYDQQTTVVTNLLNAVTVPNISIVDFDIWLYFCGYDQTGTGNYQTRVWDGVRLLSAFQPPLVPLSVTPADAGAGRCTIGTHFFGIVYQDRSGFLGQPTTFLSGAYIQLTLGSDLREITVTVSLPAIPFSSGGGATAALIMTRADTPNAWFFVPTDALTGSVGVLPVPNNSPATLVFIANISDADLAASADSANDQFLVLSQAANLTGPFIPNFVNSYSRRMMYGVGTHLYISGVGQPQQLTGDQSLLSMPNQRRIGYAFPLGNSTSLYITGDGWTAYTTDNGDVPATWPVPTTVSDALGAGLPNLVCFRTKGNYAWVATELGVFLFNGAFQDKPMTYLVSGRDESNVAIGWDRINWQANNTITMADDVTALKLYVGVPLDGATKPSHMFVIDYTNGLEYDQVDISLDIFNPQSFSSIAIVKEFPSLERNLWIGPSVIGRFAHFNQTLHNDRGAAIDSFWEAGLIRGAGQLATSMIRCGPMDVWVRGAGQLICTLYGPDRTNSFTTPLQLTAGVDAPGLSTQPGQMYALKTDLSKIENFTVRFGSNAVGAWWQLSGFRPYMKLDLANR